MSPRPSLAAAAGLLANYFGIGRHQPSLEVLIVFVQTPVSRSCIRFLRTYPWVASACLVVSTCLWVLRTGIYLLDRGVDFCRRELWDKGKGDVLSCSSVWT
jgi:hypothetical protein